MASKQQGLARDREGCHGAGPRASALPFALEQAMSASRQPTTAAGSRLDHAGDSRSDQGTERFLQDLLVALTAARAGEATRLDTRRSGLAGEVARAYNELLDQNTRFSRELARVAKVVGQEGRMTVRVQLGSPTGTWATSVDAVNSLIDDLARPTGEVARVISAAAQGDLTQKMALSIEGRPMKGEFQRIGEVVNSMVDQLRAFADEVTRVAREVGTEGKLGGQAYVKGVSGTWKDLTDNVNQLAGNLTTQVRNIAQVTTAVAKGDLSRKITVEVRGELLELKNTINTMVDQLSSFADEVTRVAREVGTEGKLGGQAEVKGVSGTWRDLTDSVNSMADNLTDQDRNIAQVTTAVVTWAMLRTWSVRLSAMELTESVRSRQVPETPLTSAWPPSLPSVPTSRATRVTSSANEESWSTMVLMVFLSSSSSPRTSTVILRDRSPLATAVVTWAMLRTWVVRLPASWLTL